MAGALWHGDVVIGNKVVDPYFKITFPSIDAFKQHVVGNAPGVQVMIDGAVQR